MTAKEYLKQIRSYSNLIQCKQAQLEELKSGQIYMSGINYDKERVNSSTSGESSYIKQAQRIIDLEIEIQKLIEEYADEKNRIIEEIGSLGNPVLEEVLYRRYVYYDNFETIASTMGYAYNYVINMHTEALELFENKVFGGK